MKFYLILLSVLGLISRINGLKCYTCTATEDDVDQRCVTDPAAVEAGSAVTNCNKNYCTSMRIEYLDPKGEVQSMYRSCEDDPTYMNQVIEDGTHRIYFTACQEDLCNGGTGRDTSEGYSPYGDESLGVLYVPGTGGSCQIETNSFLMLFLIYLTVTNI